MSCFIVLGVPRSGTSVIANILHSLGVFMGEKFSKPTPMNPKGFFEDQEFGILDQNLMNCGDRTPDNVVLNDDPNVLKSYADLIQKREALQKHWGIKCRYTSFVFHIYKKLITHPLRVIATHRPFHESVTSWMKHRDFTFAEAKKEIGNTLYARDLALSEFTGEILHIEYDELIKDSASHLECISEFVGLPLNDEVMNIIDPSMKRF